MKLRREFAALSAHRMGPNGPKRFSPARICLRGHRPLQKSRAAAIEAYAARRLKGRVRNMTRIKLAQRFAFVVALLAASGQQAWAAPPTNVAFSLTMSPSAR